MSTADQFMWRDEDVVILRTAEQPRTPAGSPQGGEFASTDNPVAISEYLSTHKGMEMVSVKDLRQFQTQDRRTEPKSSHNITEATETLLPRLTAELQAGEAIQEPLTIAYDHIDGKILLIDGNTRLAAITDAGFTHAPVVISRQNLHGFGAKVPHLAPSEIDDNADWVLPSEIGLSTLTVKK